MIPTGALGANFPMAIDTTAGRILVAFRSPPMLAAYTIRDGQLAARLPICADADDLFIDARRRRVYVSCGAGFVDVLEGSEGGYARLARVPTASGARTSLFVPDSIGSMSRPGPAGASPRQSGCSAQCRDWKPTVIANALLLRLPFGRPACRPATAPARWMSAGAALVAAAAARDP